jgi:hypothetical protein
MFKCNDHAFVNITPTIPLIAFSHYHLLGKQVQYISESGRARQFFVMITLPDFYRRSSNCVVCLLRSNYDLCQLLLPLKGYCQHSWLKLYRSKRPYFRFLRRLQIFDYVFQTFLCWPIFTYFYYLPSICSSNNKSLCLILLTDQSFVISTCVVSLIHITQFKTKHLEANGWISIVENRRSYGLKDVFNSKKSKTLIRRRNLMLAAFYVLIIGTTVIQLVVSYDNIPWNGSRKFLLLLCFTFQGYISLDLTQRFKIIGAILDALKRALTKKRSRNLKRPFIKYNNLILAIRINLNLFMKMMTVPLVSWILTVIGSLILNIYISIKFPEYDLYTLILLQSRTVVTIMSIFIILYSAEKNLKEKVSRFYFSHMVLKFVRVILAILLRLTHYRI